MEKTATTLSGHKHFIITVFDNSQVNIPKKFQQFGSCANMAIATCRLFVEPTIREYAETMEVPNEVIPITYIDQAIPLPYGILQFEDIVSWNVGNLDDACLLNFEELIDVTGARMTAYCEFCRLLSTMHCCKRMIPYLMEAPYSYSDKE